MIIRRRRTSLERWQLCLYSLFIVCRLLYNSNFVFKIGGLLTLFNTALKLVIVFFSLFAIIATKKYKVKELVAIAVLVVTSFAALLRNDYDVVFLTILMVASMRRIPFQRIVKYTLYGQILGALLVVGSCFVGLIEDYTYGHQMLSGTTIVTHTAHTYGFTYFTTPAYLMLAIMMEWNYLHFDKVKLPKLVCWGVVQYGVYLVFSSRASFYMSIMYLALLLLFSADWFKMKSWIWKAGALLAVGVLLIVNVILVQQYANGNMLAISINTLTSGRLSYAAKAISLYGVRLLGGQIPMVGGYEANIAGAQDYFYLDSGYLYSLLCYGILITVLLVIAYTIIFADAANKRDKSLYCWLLVFVAINLNNNMFVSVHYMPLLFLLPHALTEGTKHVKTRMRAGKQRRAGTYE